MKCPHCYADNPDGAKYCSCCGEPIVVQETHDFSSQTFSSSQPFSAEQTAENPGFGFRAKLLSLTGPWLLSLAILETVAAAVGLANRDFEIFAILSAVFLWLMYSSAKKGTVDLKNLRRYVAVSRAKYIVMLVAVGLFAVVGVLAIALAPFSDKLPENVFVYAEGELEFLAEYGDNVVLIACGIVLLTVAAVLLVFTLCGYKKIHNYLRSLYISAENDAYTPDNPDQAGKWMIVFGVLNVISALSGGVRSVSGGLNIGLISSGCSAAVLFIGYAVLKKLEAKD